MEILELFFNQKYTIKDSQLKNIVEKIIKIDEP